ncbi:molybdopterin molybdotransferase MoeA [Chitinibacteraceae bacterium HSL-7]
MLTVADALSRLLAAARPVTATETLPLAAALGRTLASDIVSTLAVPAFDNSAMDGYALHVCDEHATRYPVSQRIAAGDSGVALAPGEAARIFTGAPVPPGTTTVVMQEDTTLEDGVLVLDHAPPAGTHIRLRGEDVDLGQTVFEQGRRLGAAELGLLAAIGVAQVTVLQPLRVALLSTGNELVEPGQPLGAGQIYNSNRYAIGALLKEAGCVVSDLGIVGDTLAATTETLQQAAAQHDIVLTTGGVSVGEEDHVKAAVSALGQVELWKIAIKPGKPFAFGRIGHADFIGLPGNPVSSFVTFKLFVEPLLAARLGGTLKRPGVTLPASFSRKAGGREEYLRVRITDGRVELHPNQGSGVLGSVTWADALAIQPADVAITAGDPITVLLFAKGAL